MNIFLSYSFRDEDKELVDRVKQLLTSHGIDISIGENLGGEQLTPAVAKEIENADGLIAILTKRESLSGGGWTTHQWAVDELNHAYSLGKKAIALLEVGVDLKGMRYSHEHIQLDSSDQLPAFLALSNTIGRWKRKIGRTLKFQIQPSSLAEILGRGNGDIKCKYRLWTSGKAVTDWEDAMVAPEELGTFVYIDVVQEYQLVQLRVEDQGIEWLSPAKSQWMQIELTRRTTEHEKPD